MSVNTNSPVYLLKNSYSCYIWISLFSDVADICANKKLETLTHCNSTTTQQSNLPTKINSKRVPNIIMLGPTGAGKSFFGNGLFGEKHPEEGTIIYCLLFFKRLQRIKIFLQKCYEKIIFRRKIRNKWWFFFLYSWSNWIARTFLWWQI